MRIPLDREKRITLLKWLKQDEINTLDMKELMHGFNFFEEMLKEIDRQDEVERERTSL